MKKTGIIFLCSALAFTACKKEQNVNPDSPKGGKARSTQLAKMSSTDLADLVTVSERGYLVIAGSEAYAAYLNFLEESSVDEIAAFHNSIGFVSQASVQGQAGNYIAPSASNGEYVFSQTGMVQIGSILYRGVNSEGYLLAMPVSSLNDATYEAMVSRSFSPQTMCRLKPGGDYGDNLEAFVLTHTGFDEPSDPPTPPVVCERKVTHTYSAGGVTIMDESWYFLGIRYRHIITIHDDRP